MKPLELAVADIRARFEWAIRQGHPMYLWPDVPIQQWRECLFEIERVSASVLAGIRSTSIRTPPNCNDRAMGIAAFSAGMGPLLGYWIETGSIEANEGLCRLFALHLGHGRAYAERLGTALSTVLGAFERAGIEPTVIKGAYTARTYFPEIAVRPAADVDLVVDQHEQRAAAAALELSEYRTNRRIDAPKSEWRPAGTTDNPRSLELIHAESGYSIDLHDSLARSLGGIHRLTFGRLSEITEPWPDLPGARRLLPIPNTAYLALHISDEWHRLQLIRVVELVLVLRRDFAARSNAWSDLLTFIQQNGLQRFVYLAFELAERLGPGTVQPEFRQQLKRVASERVDRVIEGLRPMAPRMERLSLEELLVWSDGSLDVLRRLADLVVPLRLVRSGRPIWSVYRERFYKLARGPRERS